MKIMARLRGALAVLAAMAATSSADAALMEIRFEGKIDYLKDAAGVVDDSVHVGDRAWMSLIHDLSSSAPTTSSFANEKLREGAGTISPLISYAIGSGSWSFGEMAVSSRAWAYERGNCCLDRYGGEVRGAQGRATADVTSVDNILPFDFVTEMNRSVPVTSTAFFFFDGYRSGVTFQIDRVSITALPAVPEPSTWAMLMLGFAMIGGAVRFGRDRLVATRA